MLHSCNPGMTDPELYGCSIECQPLQCTVRLPWECMPWLICLHAVHHARADKGPVALMAYTIRFSRCTELQQERHLHCCLPDQWACSLGWSVGLSECPSAGITMRRCAWICALTLQPSVPEPSIPVAAHHAATPATRSRLDMCRDNLVEGQGFIASRQHVLKLGLTQTKAVAMLSEAAELCDDDTRLQRIIPYMLVRAGLRAGMRANSPAICSKQHGTHSALLRSSTSLLLPCC